MAEPYDTLMRVQEHDTARDRLRHRRASRTRLAIFLRAAVESIMMDVTDDGLGGKSAPSQAGSLGLPGTPQRVAARGGGVSWIAIPVGSEIVSPALSRNDGVSMISRCEYCGASRDQTHSINQDSRGKGWPSPQYSAEHSAESMHLRFESKSTSAPDSRPSTSSVCPKPW